jgi:LuxR family maltose regulon positive regulatory protein
MSLLRTKLYIPRLRPGQVPRPRLIERLDAVLQRKLTLVCAPAGFGKTALLSEWIHGRAQGETPLHVAWLSLDPQDNDPARFLAYLVGSLETTAPQAHERAQAALQATQPSPGGSTGGKVSEPVLAALINQVSTLPYHLVLVLDDYQAIRDPAIHGAVAFVIEHLPDNGHLVIGTRADPPFPAARLRGQGQLNELRQEDLRFTANEAAAFLNEAMDLGLSPEQVAALTARTEGWIAGLQMAAISIRGQKQRQSRVDLSRFVQELTGSHRFILDYLTEEVLDQQTATVQAFLLETSILDRLTGPLCEAVCTSLGDGEGRAMLERLERGNHFVVPLDDERRWYRYHRLFADLLRQRLERAGPNRLPPLHRRAGKWYEEQELLPAAIEHALASGDADWAAALIERAAEPIMLRSEAATLDAWVRALPDEAMSARPLLCIYHAIAILLNSRPLDAAEVRIEQALAADATEAYAGEVAAYRALIAAYQEDADEATRQSERALAVIPEDRLFFRSFVVGLLGIIYYHRGDVAAARATYAEAARIGQRTGNVTIAVLSLYHLGELAHLQGHLAAAEGQYEQVIETATNTHGERRPIAGLALLGLAQVAYERGQLETACQHVEEGIALISEWGKAGAITGYVTLARIRQAQGRPARAREAIETAAQLAAAFDAMQVDDVYVAAAKARLQLLQGEVDAVQGWAVERGLEAAGQPQLHREMETGTLPFMRAAEYIVLARFYLVQRRAGTALDLLQPLVQLSESAGWTALALRTSLMQALAYTMRGDVASAMPALGRALALGGPERHIGPFLEEGEALCALLRQAVARGIGASYAAHLLAVLEGTPVPPEPTPTSVDSTPRADLPEALTGRETQVLRLLATHLSSTEMSEELVISPNTVRTHIKHIYDKLGVHSRAEAVARAQALDLL